MFMEREEDIDFEQLGIVELNEDDELNEYYEM